MVNVRNVSAKRCSSVLPERAHDITLVERRKAATRSCRTDSTSVSLAPRAAPRSCTRLSSSANSARRARDRCRRVRPVEHAGRGGERLDEIGVAGERLQDAVRRKDHREGARRKRQGADVTADSSVAAEASRYRRAEPPRRLQEALEPTRGQSARTIASAPSDRCPRDRRLRAQGATKRDRCRIRARARCRSPVWRHASRTARRGGPAFAHSPSRRTGRTRPTPSSLRHSLGNHSRGRSIHGSDNHEATTAHEGHEEFCVPECFVIFVYLRVFVMKDVRARPVN